MGQLAEPSQVRVTGTDGGDHTWDVDGGFLSVTDAVVTVLAESATSAAAAKH
jgi:F0F1-type ATP synthase epsilon subunit